jgi:hypothetical protein
MDKYEDIQFFHDFENGCTYALEVNFLKEDLLESLCHPFTKAKFNLGVSYLHPDDNYSKEIGREVSSGKLEPEKFNLLTVARVSDMIYITYENEDMYLKFRLFEHSSKPHFIGIELKD